MFSSKSIVQLCATSVIIGMPLRCSSPSYTFGEPIRVPVGIQS